MKSAIRLSVFAAVAAALVTVGLLIDTSPARGAGTININKSNYGQNLPQTIPAQTVPSDGNYDLVATIQTKGVSRVTITGVVGGTGPLTGLQLTSAAVSGGTHVALLTDSDFSTATDTLLRTLGLSSPTNIVTGSKFQITVDLMGGIDEIKLLAKTSAGATLAVEASGS